MDPTTNPFAPGAGNQPPELAGRDQIIDEATVYFLQEWGSHAWNKAGVSPITLDDVRSATDDALRQLDTVWGTLVYTVARQKQDPNARDLVSPMSALVERVTKLRVDQWAAWAAEIEAQAAVDAADAGVDLVVDDLDRALLNELRDRAHPTYRRYFATPRNEIVALGLESELKRIRSWPEYLAAESSPALQAFADRVRAAVATGDAALEARRQAATARANQRAVDIQTFFDDVNGARRSLHAQLTQRAVDRHLDRHWPDGFFQHASRKRGTSGPGTPA